MLLLLLLLQAHCGQHWPRRHGWRERDAARYHGQGEREGTQVRGAVWKSPILSNFHAMFEALYC
jgi:hypothetical protein